MTTALLVGRYQPFHNGHLEVVKKILEECDLLVIVIGSSQYSHTKENPFTGGERLSMIEEVLADEKIPLHRYTIVPIPDINNNALWVSHVKTFCPPFDVAYTRNQLSKRLFEEAGVKVKQQPSFDRERYSGTKIREKMITDHGWEELVPSGVARVIKKIDGIERLKSIVKED
jgi:nicotinamide-nucleotide adenylyltransferase